MADRVIGVLGGIGPEATADFYREILRLTPARADQDHIPVLIYSNPKIPDRTKAILDGGEDPLPYLIQSARILESGGAGIVTIPCNTAHYFLPALQSHIKIPILNMLDETLRGLLLRLPTARAVGVLATTGTIRSEIYSSTFSRAGVRIITPRETDQEKIHSAILSVKASTYDQRTRDIFQSIGGSLVKGGAEAVILGCTEIPLAFDQEAVSYPCLNPTRFLAQAAVDWALRKREWHASR
jgi:aspartate racemase